MSTPTQPAAKPAPAAVEQIKVTVDGKVIGTKTVTVEADSIQQ